MPVLSTLGAGSSCWSYSRERNGWHPPFEVTAVVILLCDNCNFQLLLVFEEYLWAHPLYITKVQQIEYASYALLTHRYWQRGCIQLFLQYIKEISVPNLLWEGFAHTHTTVKWDWSTYGANSWPIYAMKCGPIDILSTCDVGVWYVFLHCKKWHAHNEWMNEWDR